MENRYAFETLIYVCPADDVPGQWIAHAIENDVVSQGNDVVHAIKMGIEATTMVALDDYVQGRDPRDRGKLTPPDVRERAYRVLDDGVPFELAKIAEHTAQIGSCVVVVTVIMDRIAATQERKPRRAFVSPQLEAPCY